MAAISLEAVNNYGTRYHTQRINRRLDDRDNVLKEALAQLEEHDHAAYPTIESITAILTSAGSVTALGDATNNPVDICVCTGANFSADETKYSIRIGGQSGAICKAGATTEVFTVRLAADKTYVAGNHLVQIRISDVLCTEFYITLA